MPEMTPVRSSNIAAIGYDPAVQELIVQFRSGAEYAYSGVDTMAYIDFFSAASPGKHFAQWIKDAYPTRRIA